MTDEQIAASNDQIITKHTNDWLRGDRKTRYGIQRVSDAYWFAGGNLWSVRASLARWFDTMTEANLAGVFDISDPVHTWTARPIPKEAY